MKKWTYHHIFQLLILCCALLIGVILLLQCFGIVLCFDIVGSEEMVFALLFLIGYLLLIWFAVWRCQKANSAIKRVMLAAAVLVLWVFCSFFTLTFYLFSDLPGEYHSFESANEAHTVVVRHQTFFTASWGTVYEKTSPVTMTKVGTYSLGDAYSASLFRINWGETTFEIDFGPCSYKYEYLKGD